MSDHQKQIEALTQDLVTQGTRVQRQLEASFEALFQKSSAKAAEAAKLDDEIDAVDVVLEQRSVSLLTSLTRTTSGVTEFCSYGVLIGNSHSSLPSAAATLTRRFCDCVMICRVPANMAMIGDV